MPFSILTLNRHVHKAPHYDHMHDRVQQTTGQHGVQIAKVERIFVRMALVEFMQRLTTHAYGIVTVRACPQRFAGMGEIVRHVFA